MPKRDRVPVMRIILTETLSSAAWAKHVGRTVTRLIRPSNFINKYSTIYVQTSFWGVTTSIV